MAKDLMTSYIQCFPHKNTAIQNGLANMCINYDVEECLGEDVCSRRLAPLRVFRVMGTFSKLTDLSNIKYFFLEHQYKVMLTRYNMNKNNVRKDSKCSLKRVPF